MKRGLIAGAFLIACMFSFPRPAAAQQHPSLSVEATLGRVFGYTAAEYLSDRRGSGVDLMLGVRAGAAGKRGIVLGANAGFYDGGPRTLRVLPDFRRHGVGRAFLNFVEESCAQRVIHCCSARPRRMSSSRRHGIDTWGSSSAGVSRESTRAVSTKCSSVNSFGRGFTRVWNLAGGIDRWTDDVDASVPWY